MSKIASYLYLSLLRGEFEAHVEQPTARLNHLLEEIAAGNPQHRSTVHSLQKAWSNQGFMSFLQSLETERRAAGVHLKHVKTFARDYQINELATELRAAKRITKRLAQKVLVFLELLSEKQRGKRTSPSQRFLLHRLPSELKIYSLLVWLRLPPYWDEGKLRELFDQHRSFERIAEVINIDLEGERTVTGKEIAQYAQRILGWNLAGERQEQREVFLEAYFSLKQSERRGRVADLAERFDIPLPSAYRYLQEAKRLRRKR
jgi:hypothetical protein